MKKINLNGKWHLKLDAQKIGIEKKYFENCQFDNFITLPGTISEQKKSPQTDEKATGFLTDPYKFEGWAWFQKSIKINNKNKSENNLFRLTLERTRYSTLWINGKKIGTKNTLSGRHVYDFLLSKQELKKSIKITIMISNVDYIVPGGHLTSQDTQTNWNGITGEISLEQLDEIRLEKTIINAKQNELFIKTNLIGNKEISVLVKLKNVFTKKIILKPGENNFNFKIDDVKLWSDTNPNLYKLKLILQTGKNYNYTIGFKTFEVEKTFIYNNKKKVFLRGKHDGMIFPLTGYAPCDKKSWLKVMKKAKEYGINHYRFHTCCPPEAAFEAADELGIFMAPELPFWGTISAPNEEGYNKEQQDYLIKEGFEILDNFRNHTSFVMMSMGNELWGSENRLDEIMKAYHAYDSTKLYSGGSNNFQFWPRTTEHEDYFVGVRFGQNELIRGSYAQCDAPLGFIQTEKPNTNHDYDIFFKKNTENEEISGEKEIEIQFGTGVKKIKTEAAQNHFLPEKPCISHEVGQYCMYPKLSENRFFKGVLKPYNFEKFEARLEKAGMKTLSNRFFKDSANLAVQCYKNEIEAAFRSNNLSGFQLLDIQDFTGQGTAVVGILNAFMKSKKIITGKKWRNFCNDKVLLASFEKYIWKENETFQAKIFFHNFSDDTFLGKNVEVCLIDSSKRKKIIYKKIFKINSAERGNEFLGNFDFKFLNIKKTENLKLCLKIKTNKKIITNSYSIDVYPELNSEILKTLNEFSAKETVEYKNIILTKNLETAKSSKNKKIIYFPTDFKNQETIPGTYCTDFWCYPMFRSISESMKKPVPIGTLGLTIKSKSPIIKNFSKTSSTTPKWYNLISHSTCVNLTKTNLLPEIQMIDNFERNWKLGLLYKKDGILVCNFRIWEIANEPEVHAFFKVLENLL